LLFALRYSWDKKRAAVPTFSAIGLAISRTCPQSQHARPTFRISIANSRDATGRWLQRAASQIGKCILWDLPSKPWQERERLSAKTESPFGTDASGAEIVRRHTKLVNARER
jgi:hypothetical protein